MAKTALITGITGQDGAYLSELLLSKGYRVVGMVRRSSTPEQAGLPEGIEYRQADLLDQLSLLQLLEETEPDEVYNLAAQSFIPTSWEQPVLTGELTALGAARLLEAIRKVSPKSRFYQASSSEMFGRVEEWPQNERTPFRPRTPYGVAKLYAHFITINYRETYGLFAASGILFNHESPRRSPEFLTRKVTRQAARIKLGLAKEIQLGNLDASRDWGFAGDYVRAMWLMLQQREAQDFVIGTGKLHTVRDFVTIAFEHLGLDWQEFVKKDPRLVRPAELEHLVADASKAREMLTWEPNVAFEELVRLMVESDLQQLKAELSRS